MKFVTLNAAKQLGIDGQVGSVEVGKGVIDIPGVLRALLNLKFKYHVALEYEANANDPMPGIKDSIQYIRRVLKEI